VAITFVGSAVASATDGGTVELNLAGLGLEENDVVVAFGIATGGTAAPPTGYTSAGAFNEGGGILLGSLSYKRQTSSTDTVVSFWDTGSNTNSGTAIALAFRGVDTTTALDVAAVGNNNNPPDPSSITPANNNCCIVIVGGTNSVDNNIGTVTNYTHPTNHKISSEDDESTTIAGAYRILSGGASSAENPGTWSGWAAGDDIGVAYTVALRPLVDIVSSLTATPTIAAFTPTSLAKVVVAASSTPTFANFTAVATADNAEEFAGNLLTASPTIGAFTLSAFIASASLAKYDIRGRSSGRSIVCRPL
jgi:hypothetical protein